MVVISASLRLYDPGTTRQLRDAGTHHTPHSGSHYREPSAGSAANEGQARGGPHLPLSHTATRHTAHGTREMSGDTGTPGGQARGAEGGQGTESWRWRKLASGVCAARQLPVAVEVHLLLLLHLFYLDVLRANLDRARGQLGNPFPGHGP